MSASRQLASKYWVSGWPEIVAEWHPTRNAALDPGDVSYGSGRKVWWKCPRGPDHEWRASPNNRTAGRTGCPFCAGREVSVTNSLATLRPDLAKQWHSRRNGKLAPERIVAGSARAVWWKCTSFPAHEWRVSPHDRLTLMGGCPFCLDLRVCSTNSLAVTQPRIAAEWHSTKNHHLTPHDVVEGSARRVWWRCSRHSEHEWCASLSNRTLRGSGCPFCSGKRGSAQHCLAVAHPEIAREWHPTRNGVLTPESVTPYARRKVWWLCASGHEWLKDVCARTRRRRSCPTCSRKARVRASGSVVASATSRGLRSIAGDIREQHRRIEQILILLVADPGVEDPVLSRFVAEVTAHLDADASTLYPTMDRALGHPATQKQRELQNRLRQVLCRILPCRDPLLRGDRLRELQAAFQEHSRFEERVALPAVESAMDHPSLAALGGKMRGSKKTGPVRSRKPIG
jgi:hypothetical protein